MRSKVLIWTCNFEKIGHLHDDVIWLQLPECFEASYCIQYFFFCENRSSVTKSTLPRLQRNAFWGSLVKWRHRANALLGCVLLLLNKYIEQFHKRFLSLTKKNQTTSSPGPPAWEAFPAASHAEGPGNEVVRWSLYIRKQILPCLFSYHGYSWQLHNVYALRNF